MISRGSFFSDWANSSGHFLRVNSSGQLLSTTILLLGRIFVDIFGLDSSGHFLMVITNSANTVDQPRECGGEANTFQYQVRLGLG